MLIRVVGPHFVAGLVFEEDGVVTKAAPILRWATGLSTSELRLELKKRGYRAHYVRTLTRPELDCDG
jgi:hypothetical protein